MISNMLNMGDVFGRAKWMIFHFIKVCLSSSDQWRKTLNQHTPKNCEQSCAKDSTSDAP